ncbi:MAG: dienelactone hydrolase [Bradymonadia bacterium]|jgi:dienelactone hydrolase
MLQRLLLLSSLLVVGLVAGCSEQPVTPAEPEESAPAEQQLADDPRSAEPAPNTPPGELAGSLAEPAETLPGSRYTLDAVAYSVARLSATPVRFPAPTERADFEAWRQEAKERLVRSLHIFRLTDGHQGLEPVVMASESFDGYRRDEVSYFVDFGLRGRAFLYVPDAPGPHPAIVFWHGHTFGGYLSSAGIEPYGAETNAHHGGAAALAEAGYVVLAPNVRTFGESGGVEAHEHYERILRLAGGSALGTFASDAHRAVDFLTSLSYVDADRIGVTGLSLGGLLTLLSAALDERVAAAAPQSFFGSYRRTLLTTSNCPCNYAGVLGVDFDIADLAALAAPTPMLIVAGTADSEFPVVAMRDAFAQTSASYQLIGSDALELAEHSGGHEWIAEPAIAFFDQEFRSQE